ILAHEGLYLYFPYLLSLLFFSSRIGPTRLRLAWCLLPAVTGAVAFVFSVWFHGDRETALALCRSYPVVGAEAQLCGPTSAIFSLATSAREGHGEVMQKIDGERYLATYSLALALAVLPYAFYLASRVTNVRDRRFFRAVLGTPLVAWLVSSPLFFLAIDWGRFIYIHAMCMLIIVMCHEIQMRQQPSVPAAPVAPVRLGFVACAVIYMTSWKLPHCCGRGLELTAFYQN